MFRTINVILLQVLVRNIPPDQDESVTELVEHFFLVNHPEHYLTHQVVYNANSLAKLVTKKKKMRNWLDYYQGKFFRNQSAGRPAVKVYLTLFSWQITLLKILHVTLIWSIFSLFADWFPRPFGSQSRCNRLLCIRD